MSTVAPFLAFPADHDGWFAFVRQLAENVAEVRRIDERLTREDGLTTLERLELWDRADELLSAIGIGYLVSEAHPDADVRAAAEQEVQRAEAFATERMLDRALWNVFAELTEDGLDDQAARRLEFLRRDFRRGGIDLDDDTRETVQTLTERATQLALDFSRHVRDDRREIRVAPEALAGLPQDFIDAHPVGDDGLVVLTTAYPDLMPVREYARDRAVRTALVSAYNDLAWPQNEAILAELLTVRQELAELLGYADWAEYETETRMIGSGAAIPAFLDELADVARPVADREYDVLLERLREDEPDAGAVTIADQWYLLGAVKREQYAVDAQEVRSYFSFDRVLDGLLEVTGRLFDLEYVPVDVRSWHDDVRSYDVRRGDEVLGRIHLDLHPRDGKYSHAACFPLVGGVAGRSLPEAVLLCNFAAGLMEHDEVVTFFHEFGHLVHHLLASDAEWVRFSGIQTEWDFVEAPSQLLEEWAWDAGVLATFTADADGRPIPADLVERMRTADAFGRALEVTRQLGHANVSYHLHVGQPDDLQAATAHWYTVSSPVLPLPGSHSYAGFGHLTGYGACYYTYQWSLVIARDLLTRFDGDLMDPTVASAYRDRVLVPGASRDAAVLVEDFLGRPSTFDAYRAWLSAGPA